LKHPERYLSATQCRQEILAKEHGVDACALVRIHGLLSFWGIINFRVPEQQKESMLTFLTPHRKLLLLLTFV